MQLVWVDGETQIGSHHHLYTVEGIGYSGDHHDDGNVSTDIGSGPRRYRGELERLLSFCHGDGHYVGVVGGYGTRRDMFSGSWG